MQAQAEPVSVVMPVRNALPHLHQAVRSILDQTHRDFELIVRDDGSTDGSTEALREWARRDARIRLFEGAECLGPAGSSNWVVDRARTEIVARMDADDVSLPERLERQLRVLRSRPDAVLVGAMSEGIDPEGRVVHGRDRSALLTAVGAPFPHGSVMFRKSAFDRVGGYSADADFWEDQHLFMRLSRIGKILTIPQVLYRYRYSPLSSRFTSDRGRVVRCVSEGIAQIRRFNGGPEIPSADARSGRVHPEVLLSLCYHPLWLGKRPRMFVDFLRRAQLGLDRRTARTLLWSLWSEVAPGTLRRFTRARLARRDRAAAGQVRDDGLYEWPVRA